MPVGQVNLVIYYGTKYDYLNIPYVTTDIEKYATKTKQYNGTYVWQSTWLSAIKITVDDYQDIVGAQYVKIIEQGATSSGDHWCSVLGYVNLTRKTVELGLMYEPLLSIGVSNIRGINGILKRHTVSDDAHFNYVNSPEPINQIDDLDFSYWRYKVSTQTTKTIVGFPYDMTGAPDVMQYTNRDGTITPIYYPKMGRVTPTIFTTRDGSGLYINDGMKYYEWPVDNVSGEVVNNYSKAVGLGFELPSTAYILPINDLLQVVKSGESCDSILGFTKTVATGLGLYDTTYNNNKAGDIGIFFSLYNEASGESLTLKSEDLGDTTLEIGCNPYVNGYFFARFKSYYHDTGGLTGIVKSVGYQPFSLTGNIGFRTTLNRLENTIASDESFTSYVTGLNSADTVNRISKANNIAMTGQDAISIGAGLISGSANPIDAMGASANAIISNYRMSGVAKATYENSIQNLTMQFQQQRQALTATGTIGQVTPPSFKLNNALELADNPFDFVVKRSSLSVRDRQRADRFFTAFGYNVDNTILNDYHQLSNRQRFTFIMADDINITAVAWGTDLTRLRDYRTLQSIRDRFSAGIRIWNVEPDYDWTIKNNIK